eukprot:scaffold461388_cov39-Attheya_sp.AAC.1
MPVQTEGMKVLKGDRGKLNKGCLRHPEIHQTLALLKEGPTKLNDGIGDGVFDTVPVVQARECRGCLAQENGGNEVACFGSCHTQPRDNDPDPIE